MIAPPKPTKTLAELRAESPDAWDFAQMLIREFLRHHPDLMEGIGYEGAVEAIEKRIEDGRLQFARVPVPGGIGFAVQKWDGEAGEYRVIGNET